MIAIKAMKVARAAYRAEKLRRKQSKAQAKAHKVQARLKQAKAETADAQNLVAALIMDMGAK